MMASESNTELQMEEAAANSVQSPIGQAPDSTWSNERLLDYGTRSLGEGDQHAQRLHALARKSVVPKFRAGHAFSILQERLTATGNWCAFQEDNDLPRTKVWEVINVYRKATELGHGEEDVANYGTWTEVMVAYGVVKPRKAEGDEPAAIAAGPSDDSDGEATADDDGITENDWPTAEDEESAEDSDEAESEDEPPDAEPEETAEEELPPVTGDQVVAADTFVAAVGGVEHAVRVLIARSATSGDKEGVKDALSEMVRAARTLLTPAEITEIVIVGNARAKGIQWASV